MNGLNKTNIDWAHNPDGTPGYTLNLWTGCLNHKDGYCLGGGFPCYAHRGAHGRMKTIYLANKNWNTRTPKGYTGYPNLDPFYPRLWPGRFKAFEPRGDHAKRRGIFLNSMSEWAAPWVPRTWQDMMFDGIRANPDDRFYLCTKQPQELVKFSPFPDNCYIGVTATTPKMFIDALAGLTCIEATVKFVSIEPYLIRIPRRFIEDYGHHINWIIIGACTGTLEDLKPTAAKYPELTLMPLDLMMRRWSLQPKPEWVQAIVSAADEAGMPVFIKDNMSPLFYFLRLNENRREMPNSTRAARIDRR